MTELSDPRYNLVPEALFYLHPPAAPPHDLFLDQFASHMLLDPRFWLRIYVDMVSDPYFWLIFFVALIGFVIVDCLRFLKRGARSIHQWYRRQQERNKT